MRFNSKIDKNRYITLLLVAGVFMFQVYQMIEANDYSGFMVFFAILELVFLGYVLDTLFQTYYVIRNEELLVRSGNKRIKIPYSDIKGIAKVKSDDQITGRYALSSDVIAVVYIKGIILISPKYKEDFVKALAEKIGLNIQENQV